MGLERQLHIALSIAGAMIDHIAAYVDFPEIDVRQRLAVSKGYGVTEMSIPTGSPLTGRSIKEAMTVEMDINVLTLYRGTRAIPNPRLDRTLEAEDRLLCFGKLDSMRTMVPKGSRRRRQPAIRELASKASTKR